jgi:hypothetical protein
MGMRELVLTEDDTSAEVRSLMGVGGGEARHLPYLGIRALMLAVLDDAVRSYLGPPTRERLEAESWISNRHGRHVFSFPTVCETLGLEPSAVRAALRRMQQRATPIRPVIVDRARPNARRQAGLRIALPRPRRIWKDPGA